MIEVVAAGPLATVQDLGRRGWAALGVPRSGVFDRRAAALANRLVGNAARAALIEITLGGFAVRFDRATTFALTGAPCTGSDWGIAITVRAGSMLRLGTPAVGLRSYLAVRGGVDVEPVLGSRSADLLSGLGPVPLRAGDRVDVGTDVTGPPGDAPALVHPPGGPVQVLLGPRADWFAADAFARLCSTAWTVRAHSDRVGVRLEGPGLPRIRQGELPSEATRPGAVQVPADGRPIVFGPDAPVTGGYPVLAVVTDAGLDLVAQLRPGDVLRFAPAR